MRKCHNAIKIPAGIIMPRLRLLSNQYTIIVAYCICGGYEL